MQMLPANKTLPSVLRGPNRCADLVKMIREYKGIGMKEIGDLTLQVTKVVVAKTTVDESDVSSCE